MHYEILNQWFPTSLDFDPIVKQFISAGTHCHLSDVY